MNNIDLNINNYEYEDILNLFQIKYDFGEKELKKAKQKVLMMHPDKSGLNKDYFLFFSSAFKTLHSIYEFREKANASEKLDIKNNNTEYISDNNDTDKELINSIKNKYDTAEFNKWFNNLFEKTKIENEDQKKGYGNWLKEADENEVIKCNNSTEMNQAIENKKKLLRKNALSKYNEINEFNSQGYSDLTNSCPEEYSSGMFSKLQYEDLKKAHSESVVPVTNEDFKPNYSSMEDIRIKRQQQYLDPLSQTHSKEYLNNKKTNDNVINSQRAFKLATQDRKAQEANKNFLANLKLLK